MIKENDLPDGWKIVELAELIECLDNKRVPLNAEQRSKIQGQIPYYGANGQLDSINQYLFDEKLLLLAEDGGAWGLKQRCAYQINGKSWINNHAHVLRMKESICMGYLMHFLNYSDLSKYITGTTRGKLNRKSMDKINVVLPPLQYQKKIVAILEKAERLKEWRKESDELTDEFLKSIFLKMFGDPVSNPKGWDTEKIGKIAKVKTGGTPDRAIKEYWENGNIPWVKTTEIKGKTIVGAEEYITERGFNNSNATIIPKNSLLIAMYGQGKTRGKTAKLGLDTTTNQACAALLPSDNYISDFLLHLLKLSYHDLRDLGRGGNQPNLNLSIIKNFNVYLPPTELQQKFASIVQQVEQLRKHQNQSRQHIDDLFNVLMQKAFKGELV